MKHIDRPIQITTILETISSGNQAEMGAELETYIAELEAKQPTRPTRVTTILETIGSQYQSDISTSLEAYISNLEAKQQPGVLDSNRAPLWDLNNPPVWSHQRSVRRDQHRQARALIKQNDNR